ncbi:Pectic acid lyase [Anatilimnocola aggregata]|uniref:Pectic acid lyase n=1 Tax=Anatilimnocola aggregata TaxID=2528021 RepID=A0A517YD61_9BACT|nr:polysaccharide lyase [Anatilimnocola aggregata]QDU28173.1 Pectic acid lyase [Anatilimnocola aggregata]
MKRFLLLGVIIGCLVSTAKIRAADPTADEVRQTLLKAVKFAHEKVARHGGYVYLSSSDLKLREAEGIPDDDTIWVQPPGTPAVGEALLRAYQATGDEEVWRAAHAAALSLTRGQLHSGGWYYSVHFAPEVRQKMAYRRDLQGQPLADPTAAADRQSTNGWLDWKRRKNKGNITTYDDDVTQSATRFLMRMDAEKKFQDKEIHDAALYSLQALLCAQYPSGGWSSSWDRFPDRSPSPETFPIKKAELPETVSQKWPKDFTGCYVLNDNQMSNCIDTLLLAWQTYGEEKYLAAAKRAGDFLILAQLPAPQAAWAQQYDEQMRPCWCRAFEPPAITGGETQKIILSLIALYEATQDKKYLAPIPPALAYLEKSELPGGKLARFYEVRTNRPIYFQRGPGGKGHEWTYDDHNIADGYGYIVSSNVASLETKYQAAAARDFSVKKPASKKSGLPASGPVQAVIASLDSRGAWTEKGTIRDAEGKKVDPPGGIVRSETFIKNLDLLSRYVAAQRAAQN